MLQISDSRYNDIRLIFKEDGHKYNDTLGNSYKSCTTLLHDYVPAFDKAYHLKRKAKELGISEKRLEEQWNTITKEACERGTKTHNSLEDGIKLSSMFNKAVKYMIRENGEMITAADIPNIDINVKELDIKEFIDATENKFPEIYNVFQYYVDRGYKIYSEIGVFLIDYLISGTIDVLLMREDRFVIGDWKTNRGSLKFESGYYRKDKTCKPNQETDEWITKKEFLLPPVNHLPNCNGYVYNLQLSLYAWMIQYIFNIPCVGLWLCHIDSDFVLNQYGRPKRFPDGLYHVKENPVLKTTFHKMKYLKDEINSILLDRYKEVQATKISGETLF